MRVRVVVAGGLKRRSSEKAAEGSSCSAPLSPRRNEMKACQGESSLGQVASTKKQLFIGATVCT